jgi:small subunit ribosomal protein S5
MEKEEKNNLPSSSLESDSSQTLEQTETSKKLSDFETKKKFFENRKKKPRFSTSLEKVILETKRTTKVTAGGRRFSFASPGLIKDKDKELVTFAYTKGKEAFTTFQKLLKRAQRTFAHFSKKNPTSKVFVSSPRTIPYDIEVSHKNVLLRLFPAPPGSGIRAGGALRKLFKMIGFKDISAKIIGRGSSLNVISADFLALSKINWDKKTIK